MSSPQSPATPVHNSSIYYDNASYDNSRIYYPPTSDDSLCFSPTDSLSSLRQENARLQEEVMRLHRQLEWSYNALTETQKNLLAAENQLRAIYHKDSKPQNRRISSQISPSTQSRIRKVSRSLDSIQHELVRLHLEQQTITEMTEPVQLPMLNQKSPSLRAKTTKSHK